MSVPPLYSSTKDRRILDDLADLYSIIKTTEHLEKAYARDLIGGDEVRELTLKVFRSEEGDTKLATTSTTRPMDGLMD